MKFHYTYVLIFADAVIGSNMRVPGVRAVLALVLTALAADALQPRCEEITIPMCRGIGYNLTSFPNALDHDTQEEAGLEVLTFIFSNIVYFIQLRRQTSVWLT